LSNSTGIDSERPEIAALGSNVYVTWWERNQTSNEPVLRVSNDNGKTFGEKIMLSAKGKECNNNEEDTNKNNNNNNDDDSTTCTNDQEQQHSNDHDSSDSNTKNSFPFRLPMPFP
jgi:hypothetical protein